VVTTLIAHTSGEWIETRLALGVESTDPQAIGSALTYARRYGLCALVGVAPGEPDDDGAAAMPATPVTAHAQGADCNPQDRRVPEGFDAWFASLHTAANNGLASLEQAWREASGAHKQHVVTAHKEA
jgi:hypothetical protein